MIRLPETLNVGDLTLRRMEEADLPTIERQLSWLDTSEWLAVIAHPFSRADSVELLQFSREAARNIRVIDSGGTVIGCVGFGTDLWYWIDPGNSRKGIMFLVLRHGLSYLFANEAPPVSAVCRKDNLASIGLLTKLGFSRAPQTKRLFFQSLGHSELCFEYILTAEQWHYLNPPHLASDAFTIRPAVINDAPRLAQLPLSDWGIDAETLPIFIEHHRYRGPGTGLHLISDSFGTPIGVIRMNPEKPPTLCFNNGDAEGLEPKIRKALQDYR